MAVSAAVPDWIHTAWQLLCHVMLGRDGRVETQSGMSACTCYQGAPHAKYVFTFNMDLPAFWLGVAASTLESID